jgi:hypothetical protein
LTSKTSARCGCGGRAMTLACADCGQPVHHLDQRFIRHEPAGAQAHHANALATGPGWRWLGYVRGPDGLWRQTAEADMLEGLWDMLDGSWVHGDRLAVPFCAAGVIPPPDTESVASAPTPLPQEEDRQRPQHFPHHRGKKGGRPTAGQARCPRCAGTQTRLTWQTFEDGRRHLREECSQCERFIKFAPQSRRNIARAARCG